MAGSPLLLSWKTLPNVHWPVQAFNSFLIVSLKCKAITLLPTLKTLPLRVVLNIHANMSKLNLPLQNTNITVVIAVFHFLNQCRKHVYIFIVSLCFINCCITFWKKKILALFLLPTNKKLQTKRVQHITE